MQDSFDAHLLVLDTLNPVPKNTNWQAQDSGNAFTKYGEKIAPKRSMLLILWSFFFFLIVILLAVSMAKHFAIVYKSNAQGSEIARA